MFTAIRAAAAPEMPVRVHISADMPMHAEAVAAAQAAKDKPAPVQAAPAPVDKPAPVQAAPAPAKKASAPAKAKPAPVQDKPAAAPTDKPWIGTTITGKGWNIAFDQQAGRTRVLF